MGVVATAGAVVLLLTGCEETQPKASSGKPAATTASPAAARMPDVIGRKFTEAEAAVREVTRNGAVEARSAYADVELPPEHGEWEVCFQTPAAGTAVTAGAGAELSLVAPGTACPAQAGATLGKKPAKTPTAKPTVTAKPDAKPSAKPSAKPTTAKPTVRVTPSKESGGGGSVYYKNCAAARAAGAAPIRRGEPGYGKHLDRDNDGIGCDS
ncbi:excalibur calcium-binding domain-containing protein [Streptomyces venezuelae]|uniref:excalibur calcium-binding domain-containing protein n=1 Tax=Streptomyces venezuelae TaxID=54571 RepID=UPI001CC24FA6|nr:excalibur calcium-binding domain-containing protein [Streptomyces venezuelae]